MKNIIIILFSLLSLNAFCDIEPISNGESGLSVRQKWNRAFDSINNYLATKVELSEQHYDRDSVYSYFIDSLLVNRGELNDTATAIRASIDIVYNRDSTYQYFLDSGLLSNPLDSIVFNPDADNSFLTDYKVYADSGQKVLKYIRPGILFPEIINESQISGVFNGTPDTIKKCTPVSGVGIDLATSSVLIRQTYADTLALAESFLGLAENDIAPNNTGIVIKRGGISGCTEIASFDSLSSIYVASDTCCLVNTVPHPPAYPVYVGQATYPTIGLIGVISDEFKGNDTEVNLSGIANGIITQKQAIVDSVILGTLYYYTYNTEYPENDLPYMAAGNLKKLNTTTTAFNNGYARVALTPGTSSSVQDNYIYIDNTATPTLTVSTTAFPDEAIRVAQCGVFDIATHEIESFGYFRRFNNAIDGTTADGLLNKLAKRLRLEGSKYEAPGIDPTVTIVVNGAGLDSLQVSTTAGIIWQLNRQVFGSKDGKKYLWLNSPTGLRWIEDLAEIDSTEAGIYLHGGNNRRYGLNIFAIQNSGGFCDHLAVTSPTNYYTTDDAAINDNFNYSTTNVPNQFGELAVRLFRIVVNYSTAASGTITNVLGAGNYQDERGQPLGTSAGSGVASSPLTSFSAANFSIYDPTDPTKITNFSNTNITGGNTRTITMADRNIDLDDILKVGDNLERRNDSIHLSTAVTDSITNNKSFIDEVITEGTDLDLGALITNFVAQRQTGAQISVAGYNVTNFVEVYPNRLYEYTGYLEGSKGLCGYNADYEFVEAYVNTDGGIYNGTYQFTTGDSVVYIRASVRNAETGVLNVKEIFNRFTDERISDIEVISNRDKKQLLQLYIGTTGSDTYPGSDQLPLATINKAFELSKNKDAVIIVKGGEYRQTIDFTKILSNNIDIVTQGYNTVSFMGSDILENVTKRAGYNYIYKAALADIVSTPFGGKRIFDFDTPSFPITLDTSLQQQNGASYRLPYTSLYEITDQGSLALNLAYLDALSSGGGIWHDEVDDTVYIVASDLGDLSIRQIETSVRAGTIQRNDDQQNLSNLTIKDIDFYFSNDQGVDLDHFNRVDISKCRVFGAKENGWYEGAVFVSHTGSEGADCGRDGFNGHFTEYTGALLLPYNKSGYSEYKNIWAHDNGDDGLSHHERGRGRITGALSEHNINEGFSQVNGANFIYHDCVARRNDGFGFHGGHGIDDGRIATELLYFNCISDSNEYGFVSDCGTSGSVYSRVINCVAINNKLSQFLAVTSSSGTEEAIIGVQYSKYSNENIISEVNRGEVNITNSEALADRNIDLDDVVTPGTGIERVGDSINAGGIAYDDIDFVMTNQTFNVSDASVGSNTMRLKVEKGSMTFNPDVSTTGSAYTFENDTMVLTSISTGATTSSTIAMGEDGNISLIGSGTEMIHVYNEDSIELEKTTVKDTFKVTNDAGTYNLMFNPAGTPTFTYDFNDVTYQNNFLANQVLTRSILSDATGSLTTTKSRLYYDVEIERNIGSPTQLYIDTNDIRFIMQGQDVIQVSDLDSTNLSGLVIVDDTLELPQTIRGQTCTLSSAASINVNFNTGCYDYDLDLAVSSTITINDIPDGVTCYINVELVGANTATISGATATTNSEAIPTLDGDIYSLQFRKMQGAIYYWVYSLE